VVDALRAAGVTPGPVYHFPHTTHKDMKSSEVVEKFKRGPIGLLTEAHAMRRYAEESERRRREVIGDG